MGFSRDGQPNLSGFIVNITSESIADSKAAPLVSVIVRTKDRTHSLSEALKSIMSQTYANIEIVVINDGG